MKEVKTTLIFISKYIVTLAYMSFWICDLIYAPELKWEFLNMRLFTAILVSSLGFYFARKINDLKQLMITACSFIFCLAFPITIMIFWVNDPLMTYYLGLNLVAIATLTLFSWTPLAFYCAVLCIYAPYYVGAYMYSDSIELRSLAINSFANATTVLFCYLARYFNDLQKKRNLKLRLRIENEKKKVESLNSQRIVMLESMDQAFLIFRQDGLCLEAYSKSCESLLETKPNGKAIWDVLQIEDSKLDDFKAWTNYCFTETLPFKDLASLGPSWFKKSEDNHIALQFFAVRNKDSKIEHIVLTAMDLTSEIVAQNKIKSERERAKMILRIFKTPQPYYIFIEQFRERLFVINKLISQLHSTKAFAKNIDQLKKQIHTLKGGSSSLSLLNLANICHALEDDLNFLETLTDKDKKNRRINKIKDRVNSLQEKFNENFDDLKYFFKDNGGDGKVKISRKKVEQFYATHVEHSGLEEYKKEFQNLFLKQPIEELISHYKDMALNLALNENKEIELSFDCKTPIFPENYYDLLDSLVHGLRNSISHGLELPQEREALKKPRSGKLKLTTQIIKENNKNWLNINIEDDGKGIDPRRIKEKLISNGSKDVGQISDHDLIQYVFSSNLSTAEKISEISGRGQGMGAIKDEVLKLGGRVVIHSKLGQGTKLEITVPEAEYSPTKNKIKTAA